MSYHNKLLYITTYFMLKTTLKYSNSSINHHQRTQATMHDKDASEDGHHWTSYSLYPPEDSFQFLIPLGFSPYAPKTIVQSEPWMQIFSAHDVLQQFPFRLLLYQLEMEKRRLVHSRWKFMVNLLSNFCMLALDESQYIMMYAPSANAASVPISALRLV